MIALHGTIDLRESRVEEHREASRQGQTVLVVCRSQPNSSKKSCL